MTQVQLGEIAGISQPNISAYENDRRSPTIDVLNRWLVACGYQLVADGGSREVRCPLPKVGWFPLEDLPPRLPDDPPEDPWIEDQHPTPQESGEMIWELLELADSTG